MLKLAKKVDTEIVFDCETTGVNPHKARALGWSNILNKGIAEWQAANPTTKPYLQNGDSFTGHNGKYDAIIAKKNWGLDLKVGYDTFIAEYLLNIDQLKKLEEVVKRRFKRTKKDLFTLWSEYNSEQFIVASTGKKKKNPPTNLPKAYNWWEYVAIKLKNGKTRIKNRPIPMRILGEYAKEDVIYTAKIKEDQLKDFEKRPHLKKWFDEVEMPFCNILVQSELKGIQLDTNRLEEIKIPIKTRRDSLEIKLRRMAGDPTLNLNSSKQMQPILYEKFKFPKRREWRTKTGYTTGKEVYITMAGTHAFASIMLEFNELDDLLIKFINPLPELVDDDGAIHCTFNQCGTRTRRMSSCNPNLQQIPVKTKLGALVRGAFIPRKGYKFLIADYDQIEIRLAAHFSEDSRLIDSIMNAEFDVHTCTAADMYGVHPRDVTPVQRGVGKLINFSIFYGKSVYGFAKDWGCSEIEAQEEIDKWFTKRKRVKEWIQEEKLKAIKNHGWTQTLAGLPLFVGDVHHPDDWVKAKALRRAVNYPIQGSSQDILKTAVVEVHKLTNEIPLLYVHDELVYELNDDTSINEKAQDIVITMEEVWDLKVPLKVSYKISDYWEK